jgi:hypothetical protein
MCSWKYLMYVDRTDGSFLYNYLSLRVFVEKTTAIQLIKELPASYGTLGIITAHIIAGH